MVVSFGPLPDGRFWLQWTLGEGVVSQETISAELADIIFRMLVFGSKGTGPAIPRVPS